MASGPRERMVESAIVLLARHGYGGTSFDRVLEQSGAPRGSIYHHFPEGKDQLVGAAIELAGARAIALLDGLEGKSPVAVVDAFMAMWRVVLVRSDLSVGCSVLAVTVSADSDQLRDVAGEIFSAWRFKLARLFDAQGVERSEALAFATTVVAASEGAVVMSRAERSFEPFEAVARQLHRQAEGLSP